LFSDTIFIDRIMSFTPFLVAWKIEWNSTLMTLSTYDNQLSQNCVIGCVVCCAGNVSNYGRWQRKSFEATWHWVLWLFCDEAFFLRWVGNEKLLCHCIDGLVKGTLFGDYSIYWWTSVWDFTVKNNEIKAELFILKFSKLSVLHSVIVSAINIHTRSAIEIFITHVKCFSTLVKIFSYSLQTTFHPRDFFFLFPFQILWSKIDMKIFVLIHTRFCHFVYDELFSSSPFSTLHYNLKIWGMHCKVNEPWDKNMRENFIPFCGFIMKS
jgi:hypothetical protein